MRPPRPMNVHALAVWKRKLASKSDDGLPVKHGPSFLRARHAEAAIKRWGGPSPFVGMTGRLKSSHRVQLEERRGRYNGTPVPLTARGARAQTSGPKNALALAVWERELAGKSDDVLPVKHGTSLLRPPASRLEPT
jgi:hypothetical protein